MVELKRTVQPPNSKLKTAQTPPPLTLKRHFPFELSRMVVLQDNEILPPGIGARLPAIQELIRQGTAN